LNVISKRGLQKLGKRHPSTLPSLALWYTLARKAEWRSLSDVRETFPTADQVGDVLVFNVMGGNYRLIVRAAYTKQALYTKAVLNHREYDRKEWMKWA
jgi:mRNA interferase HigB